MITAGKTMRLMTHSELKREFGDCEDRWGDFMFSSGNQLLARDMAAFGRQVKIREVLEDGRAKIEFLDKEVPELILCNRTYPIEILKEIEP